MAAARLTALQGRWAKLVMYGRAYHVYNDLTRKQIQMARDDLGWRPLWDTARISAIMLYQRMRNQDPKLPHVQWAKQEMAPRGTWIAYVRSMQTAMGIPDLAVPTPNLGRHDETKCQNGIQEMQKCCGTGNTVKKQKQGKGGHATVVMDICWNYNQATVYGI